MYNGLIPIVFPWNEETLAHNLAFIYMAVFYTIVETKALSHTLSHSLHLILFQCFSLSHTCCICLGRTSVVVIERSWSGSQNCDCVQEGGYCSVFLSTYQVSFKQVCEGGGALQMVHIHVYGNT